MSDSSQKLFDRDLLRQRRERVLADFADYDFLLQRAGEDLLERLDVVLREFDVALDLGAGHGVLVPQLLQRQNIGQIIAADHSATLLANCVQEQGGKRAMALVCDEEFLPLGHETLNLVTSLLSLHFVNDLPGALIQIRRALKPDGLFMAALPGGQTLHELRTCFMQAEEEIYGGVSPRVAPMATIKDYGALLLRAGFALPVVDNDPVKVTYESPLKLMRELRLMGAGNVLFERAKKPVSRRLLARVTELYEQQFSEEGRIIATFEIIHMLGWAPHESQQQPLAPGSAQTPLSQAFEACSMPDKGEGGEGE